MNKSVCFSGGLIVGAFLVCVLGFSLANQKYNIPFEESRDFNKFTPIASLNRPDGNYQIDFYQFRDALFIVNSKGGIIQIQQ